MVTVEEDRIDNFSVYIWILLKTFRSSFLWQLLNHSKLSFSTYQIDSEIDSLCVGDLAHPSENLVIAAQLNTAQHT